MLTLLSTRQCTFIIHPTPKITSWLSHPIGHTSVLPQQDIPSASCTVEPQPLYYPTDGPSHTGPSNLEILEQGLDHLRIRWRAASGPITGYRVQYVPLTGLGQPIMAERQEVSTPTSLLRVPGGSWCLHV